MAGWTSSGATREDAQKHDHHLDASSSNQIFGRSDNPQVAIPPEVDKFFAQNIPYTLQQLKKNSDLAQIVLSHRKVPRPSPGGRGSSFWRSSKGSGIQKDSISLPMPLCKTPPTSERQDTETGSWIVNPHLSLEHVYTYEVRTDCYYVEPRTAPQDPGLYSTFVESTNLDQRLEQKSTPWRDQAFKDCTTLPSMNAIIGHARSQPPVPVKEHYKSYNYFAREIPDQTAQEDYHEQSLLRIDADLGSYRSSEAPSPSPPATTTTTSETVWTMPALLSMQTRYYNVAEDVSWSRFSSETDLSGENEMQELGYETARDASRVLGRLKLRTEGRRYLKELRDKTVLRRR